jgi:lysozyme
VKASERCLNLIKEYEGCMLKAYLCPALVWTIGYGQTGKDIVEGLVWTQEQADNALASTVTKFTDGVTSLLKVPVTQNQFDALVSFAYNVGLGSLAKSTLLKLLNSGDYSAASKEFSRWNKAGGVVLEGLKRRREAERQLFTCAN